VRASLPIAQQHASMTSELRDIAIIGGGINGCGIARDAAGRGLSVLLAEKDDLASGTSSASTKLIHGGLRYLEQYEFRFVREALKEREVLLGMAPHIISPMRFVLPHHRGLRPALMIRFGLFLYDHLGGRERLPSSSMVDLRQVPAGKPLKAEFTRGFEYSDCWVDDARLVVLNAIDAAARGADIRVRTEVVSAQRQGRHWLIELRDTVSGARETVGARAIVNAAGAWASDVLTHCLGLRNSPGMRLVKGSHIVVPRLFEHDNAYIFQNADRRVVFAIPYEHDYTLIGTTDVDFSGDLSSIAASAEEIGYLCRAVNEYFTVAVSPGDVVWSYAGVRSLYDNGKTAAQETTRDFALELDGKVGQAPLLTVIGGKITTYRHLAEEALSKLAGTFPHATRSWTRGSVLPGGNFPAGARQELARELAAALPCFDKAAADRLARTYGTMARQIFAGVSGPEELGTHFGASLYEREVTHLVTNEWAMTAEDILWRRTKLGLRLGATERGRLTEWLAERTPVPRP
jgi:glycerol-3-phosphate dehydrogenase